MFILYIADVNFHSTADGWISMDLNINQRDSKTFTFEPVEKITKDDFLKQLLTSLILRMELEAGKQESENFLDKNEEEEYIKRLARDR